MATKNVATMKATSNAARTIARHYGKRSITVEECDAEIANLQRKHAAGTLDDSQQRLASALGIGALEGNARFLIAEFTVMTGDGKNLKQIYLLNPGDCFQGFGGSSAGLVVRRTASLIVRESGAIGQYDTEYPLNKRDVWDRIFRAAHKAGYQK